MEETQTVHVKANGIMFRCEVTGQGPLCLCLHGFPESSYSWRHQVPLLARKFKVVVPDMRGYGETFAPWAVEDYRLDVLMKDVKGLIEAFGERQAVLVSHDWGAILAIHYAEAYPESVSRLVWSDGTHLGDYYDLVVKRKSVGQVFKSWYALPHYTPSLTAALYSINDFWIVEKMVRAYAVRKERFDADVMARWKASLRTSGLRGGMMYYRANAFRLGDYARRRAEASRRAKCPILAVWGDRDKALSKELAHAAGARTDGGFELVFVENCGHWVQQEAPEEYNELLADFLEIH